MCISFSVTAAMENNIVIICIPPGSSFALQPLDVAYFDKVKKLWTKIVHK